jgi:hypothetical protein
VTRPKSSHCVAATLAETVQVAIGAHACPPHMCCTLLITQKPFLFTTIRLDDCRPLPRHHPIAPHHVAQYSAPVRPEAPELAQSKPLDSVRLAIKSSPPDLPPASCARAASQLCHCGRGYQQGRCKCHGRGSFEVFGYSANYDRIGRQRLVPTGQHGQLCRRNVHAVEA